MLFTTPRGTIESEAELSSSTARCSTYEILGRERHELALQLAAFHKHLRAERFRERLKQLVSYWPVGVGLFLAAFAPALRAYFSTISPGIEAAFFPLNALATFTDLPVSRGLADSLPLILLYAQFPLDGLLARMLLRHRVTFSGVCVQVSFYHFLSLVYMLLVSGPYVQLMAR